MALSKFDLRVSDLCDLLTDCLQSSEHTEAEGIVSLLLIARELLCSNPQTPPPVVALLLVSIEGVVSEFRAVRPVEH